MRMRHACAAAAAALVAAGLASVTAAAQDRTWEVTVKLAEKTMERQPGWDFVPINDPANCLLLLRMSAVYLGPTGTVAAPKVVVTDADGGQYAAWGNLACDSSDSGCFDAMEWLLSATRPTADTREMATGDTLSTGSLEYYFEVPRAATSLRLLFGDDPPLPLRLVDRLGAEAALAPPAPAASLRPVGEEPAPMAPGEDVEALGRKLLEQARQAIGGPTGLAEIRDCVRVFTWGKPGTRTFLRRTVRWMASGPVRFEDEVGGKAGPITVLEGASGWRLTPGAREPTPLTAEELATSQRLRLGELLLVIGGYLESGCAVEDARRKAVEISCPGGVGSYLEIGDDGLPTTWMTPRGDDLFFEVLSDWRPVGSVRLPFRSTMMVDLTGGPEEIVLEWRLNVGLTAEELRTLR